MAHITRQQAHEMRKTLHQRSNSFVEFALQIARVTGDEIAVEMYEAEQSRRHIADIMTIVKDSKTTWRNTNDQR
jgi:hypothetical protein